MLVPMGPCTTSNTQNCRCNEWFFDEVLSGNESFKVCMQLGVTTLFRVGYPFKWT